MSSARERRPPSSRHARAIGLAAALLLPAAAIAIAPDAPLQIGTEGTFSNLFLELPLADARALEAPELDLRWTVANDWSIPTHLVRGSERVLLQTDEQSDALTGSLRIPWSRLFGAGPKLHDRPLFERLSTALEVRMSEHWGGWSDGVIEWWHGLIGCINFERESYPRDAITLTLQDEQTGKGLSNTSPTWAMGDVALRTQFLIAEGGVSRAFPDRSRWAFSSRLDIKAPTGSPSQFGGSGGWDVGTALLGTLELSRWLTAHAMVSISAFSGLSAPVPLQPRLLHYSADLSFPFHWGNFALILEDRFTSALFEDGWQLPSGTSPLDALSSGYYGAVRPQNQISGGVRYRNFTWWFSEDFTPGYNQYGAVSWFYNSNTPDIATGLAYDRSL